MAIKTNKPAHTTSAKYLDRPNAAKTDLMYVSFIA